MKKLREKEGLWTLTHVRTVIQQQASHGPQLLCGGWRQREQLAGALVTSGEEGRHPAWAGAGAGLCVRTSEFLRGDGQ